MTEIAHQVKFNGGHRMAVWLTVGFFEVKEARVDVGGSVYTNTFQCIPVNVPAPRTPADRILLPPRTPIGVAIPVGPLLDRFQTAMKRSELLPYVEVQAVAGQVRDVLRLNRVRVTGIAPTATHQTRLVTIVADM